MVPYRHCCNSTVGNGCCKCAVRYICATLDVNGASREEVSAEWCGGGGRAEGGVSWLGEGAKGEGTGPGGDGTSEAFLYLIPSPMSDLEALGNQTGFLSLCQ